VRHRTLLSFAAAIWLTTSPAAAEVRLAIRDGRVSLTATGATLSQILAEWEKIGQTKIFNAELVPGDPLTLQLTDVPEEQALAVLLRSISGYVAAPRRTPLADTSRFDRIMVMPARARPRVPAPRPQPGQTAPAFDPPFQPPPDFDMDDLDDPDDDTPVRVVPPPNNYRGPVFNTFPPPLPQDEPRQEPPPSPTAPPSRPGYVTQPTMPPGVAVPGMVPTPPQQDQPGTTQQPGS
jgi:hypothetical protein